MGASAGLLGDLEPSAFVELQLERELQAPVPLLEGAAERDALVAVPELALEDEARAVPAAGRGLLAGAVVEREHGGEAEPFVVVAEVALAFGGRRELLQRKRRPR